MRHLYFFTLAALALDFAWGQIRKPKPYSYLPEQVPNPQINPKECGLDNEAGYICDPNTLLTKHQLRTLNWWLKGIANTKHVQCPCSQYHCDTYNGPRFYKMAIALVPSLRLPLNTDGQRVEAVDQAQTFAYQLEHELWNISSCEEDIVVLYSRDDRTLVTMTGKTAGQRLNSDSRTIIHNTVGPAFEKGLVNQGLLRMVKEIENVLYYGSNYYPVNPVGVANLVAPSSILLSMLMLLSCLTAQILMAS